MHAAHTSFQKNNPCAALQHGWTATQKATFGATLGSKKTRVASERMARDLVLSGANPNDSTEDFGAKARGEQAQQH